MCNIAPGRQSTSTLSCADSLVAAYVETTHPSAETCWRRCGMARAHRSSSSFRPHAQLNSTRPPLATTPLTTSLPYPNQISEADETKHPPVQGLDFNAASAPESIY